jgi:uncharacterized membrane protein
MSGVDERPLPAFTRRVLPVVLAVVGLSVSAYLSAYQLGWPRRVWDPLFGEASSHAVLHSVVDRVSPVPDALLGAAAYAGEATLGLAVVVVRRFTIHALYALLALGMGIVSVGLVLLQAFVVHHACALCLLSAIVSWTVAALVVPDVVAEKRQGEAVSKFDGASRRRRSAGVASGPLISSHTTTEPFDRTA